MSFIKVEPYKPDYHGAQVYALWENELGAIWPLSRRAFDRVTINNDWYQPGDHLVVMSGATIIGFAGFQVAPDQSRGELMLVMVAREYQRQGIGSALLQAAVEALTVRGCRSIQLGGGGVSYFWPGVPTNLPHAVGFFRRSGWDYTQTAVDMVGDLSDYHTPEYVYQRIADAGITLHTADAESAQRVLKFEREHFPNWARACEGAIQTGTYDDILFATDGQGMVIGSVFVSSSELNLWEALLGTDMGVLAALGVAEPARNQGVGLALVAYASEMLKRRGVRNCLVGWTWLVDWYGRLGYKVWRDYKIAWK